MDKKQMRVFSQKIRRTPKYKEWRQKIIDRDKETGKVLQVHHLKPFTQILRDNKIETIEQAFACKELWDLDNGVTIRKGEHQILTLIERMKSFTKGFKIAIVELALKI